jgi:hypothetical protein
LQEAFTPMTLRDGTVSNYGFGWSIVNADEKHKRFVWHNGDNPGYKTHIIRFIEDHKTIIVLSNNNASRLPYFVYDLQTLILKNTH